MLIQSYSVVFKEIYLRIMLEHVLHSSLHALSCDMLLDMVC